MILFYFYCVLVIDYSNQIIFCNFDDRSRKHLSTITRKRRNVEIKKMQILPQQGACYYRNYSQLKTKKCHLRRIQQCRTHIRTHQNYQIQNKRYTPNHVELKMPRYKLGVQVILGELKGQGFRLASKSLWDPKFDNWASYTFTN